MKEYAKPLACSLYETAVGFGAVLASDSGLVAHLLPYRAPTMASAVERVLEMCPALRGSSELTRRAADLLTAYFAGTVTSFDLPLDLGGITPYRQSVYRFVATIPYGEIHSYAAVAAACGNPRGARAVGGAMAANPLAIFIPCHRVVGAGGRMTGFTAPGGMNSRRDLLLREGVHLR